jgi:DNA polymerase IV
MSAPRVILHADMDAFYAAIEQRDDPTLRGKPVVVGGLGRRGVVSTASYEARAFGVHSALATAVARRRCPDAVFLPPRGEVYLAESRRIREIFDRFTPLVEPIALDEAFLDVSGSRKLFGSGRQIAEEIRRQVREETGLVISIGIATTKYIAKVASDLDKPDGLVEVAPGTEAEFLAPLPCTRLWGAGPKTVQSLERLGLRTIGQVRDANHQLLARVLGAKSAARLIELASGRDPRPVIASRAMKSVGHERTFASDVRDRELARRALIALSEDVGRRLRKQGLTARCVRLKYRYGDFETHTRQRMLAAPFRDDDALIANALELFEDHVALDRGLRLIGISAADLDGDDQAIQGSLFASPESEGKAERVAETLDAIRERFGRSAIGRGRLTREEEDRDLYPRLEDPRATAGEDEPAS